MRLTLRTLLAYLDDTLPPDQAREIGQKVAESHVAQELIERIKKVTRRRGLTVPPATGPDRIDANTIAEYLDNDLSGDKVAEVEEMALNSDVMLAEVAACHQILTLVLGEPARVPPTARQRMYQLVKGRESVHNRRAARAGVAGPRGETVSADEVRSRRRRLVLLLGGTAVLGAALGIAIWQALQTRGGRPLAENGAGKSDQAAGSDTTAPPPPSAAKAPEPEVGTATPKVVDTTQPMTPTPMVENPPPATTPPLPRQPIDVPPDRSPSTERREGGKLVARDVVLLAQDGDAWSRVPPEANVRTTTTLMSLPGYHADVRTESGVRLTLWGNLPRLLTWPVLESVATLHAPPAGFDLDFTLQRGRVYLAAKPNGPTKIRARFAGEIWDLTLADEKSEVMLEVVTSYAGEAFVKDRAAGSPQESPLTQATLGVIAGKADVAVDSQTFSLQAPPGPAGLTWDNKRAGVSQKPLEFNAAPPFWGKVPSPPLPRERQQEIDTALRKLAQRAGEAGKSIEVAIAEMSQEASPTAKVLAILSQGALGDLPPLLDALEENSSDLRLAADLALQHFIARQPVNDLRVYEQLQGRKGYTEPQAERAVRLLHGFTETDLADPTTYERLIGDLNNERIGLRELASWRLNQADQASRISYDATANEAQREKAIGDWRKRIPPGNLPPRTGAQGKPPAPTRES
jgi:hypothetical protein